MDPTRSLTYLNKQAPRELKKPATRAEKSPSMTTMRTWTLKDVTHSRNNNKNTHTHTQATRKCRGMQKCMLSYTHNSSYACDMPLLSSPSPPLLRATTKDILTLMPGVHITAHQVHRTLYFFNRILPLFARLCGQHIRATRRRCSCASYAVYSSFANRTWEHTLMHTRTRTLNARKLIALSSHTHTHRHTPVSTQQSRGVERKCTHNIIITSTSAWTRIACPPPAVWPIYPI